MGFIIPLQVGPPTEYARSRRHWLLSLVFLLAIELICVIIFLRNIGLSIILGVMTAVGYYALYQDMNITYICAFGVMNFVLFWVCLLSQILPMCLGVVNSEWHKGDMKVMDWVTRIIALVLTFFGSFLCWNLFRDYEAAQGYDLPDAQTMMRRGAYGAAGFTKQGVMAMGKTAKDMYGEMGATKGSGTANTQFSGQGYALGTNPTPPREERVDADPFLTSSPNAMASTNPTHVEANPFMTKV